jgi:hypothetical protein
MSTEEKNKSGGKLVQKFMKLICLLKEPKIGSGCPRVKVNTEAPS